MRLCIQDPEYKNGIYLHEVLLNSFTKSSYAVGIYAFATKEGVELILFDDEFKKYIKNNKYILIVGMDEITNLRTINRLKEAQEKYGANLEVYAFIHNSIGSTFHPKYSLYQTGVNGLVVVGSGNLTQKGLRRNREAFFEADLNNQEIDETFKEWKKWFAYCMANNLLHTLDDQDVIEKAEENSKKRLFFKNTTSKTGNHGEIETNEDSNHLDESENNQEVFVEDLDDESSIDDELAWRIPYNSQILIAEIPKSDNRWKQANFDKKTFEDYFGATCGINGLYRILLRHIDHSGKMWGIESRPSVSVASRNYRFELEAGTGLAYPSHDCPIAIFAKVSTRTFLYELFMPSDSQYANIQAALTRVQAPHPNRKRRIVFSLPQILSELPDLTLWKRL